jgi:glycine hydroxymethyltransferase
MHAIVSRTGYTGEQEGYELLVHPDDAPALWRRLLEAGERFGVKPAGLGARDSLRVEAGLPLYGHELAGPFGVSPLEAGFGPYVKLHKPFFIGRDELLKRERESTNTVVRFQKTGTGMKMSKQGDAVISKKAQRVIGTVTSCAVNGESVQVGMAFVERAHAREGTRLGIVPASAAGSGARAGSASYTRGESFPVYDDAVVVSRFWEHKKK